MIPASNTKGTGLVLTVFESTERTLAQLEIKNLAYRLDQILNVSNEGICVIENDGIIKFSNDIFSDLIQSNSNFSLLNKNILTFLDDESKKLVRDWLGNNGKEEIRNIEVEIKTQVGETRVALVSLTHFSEENSKSDQKTFLCLFLDITNMKKQERELVKQKNELSTFSSFIAHDLRNNLSKMNMYYYGVKNEFETILKNEYHNTEIEKTFEKIDVQIKNLDHLISRSLELAKFGPSTANKEKTHLKSVLKNVLESIVLPNLNSSIKYPNENIYILSEEVKLYQLLLNLFANACKHSNPTKILVSYDFTKNSLNEEDFIIEICYDGELFQPEFINKFKNNEFINGIGLRIVKKIINAQNWKLEIKIIQRNNIYLNAVQIFIPEKDVVIVN